MANIRDIARQAGYSPATVSRTLNHSGYVSATAAAKIQAVIAQLDYVPNDIARDLSQGRTANVGVVVPHLNAPFFTEIVNGISGAAFAADYNVVLLQSKYDAALERTYLSQLHRKAFDALIFTSRAIPLTDLVAAQQYGAVVCCEDPGTQPLAAAYSQREAAYLQAFRWLKGQGYQHIALTLSRDASLSATSRATLAAFKRVFGCVPTIVETNVTTYQDGYRVAADLAKTPDLDYIFSNGDDIATGIRQGYLDQHRTAPALMGQENQVSGQLLGLPTIDHHFRQIGAAAFDLAATGRVASVPVTADLLLCR
ncbi:LacI family DNA-binding transcriptional regulator [Levilactobacillus wangkuiensis]|uniref:LacI family DNA-binding transcriptional regulator n=1 Tax=Levilactobacillus wangkuiensis TaxID=2799566 RepID=UPI0019458E74|nr:LacI family DNA-binding transcriptional regulator [Levilactobacillus wangkuiensis]